VLESLITEVIKLVATQDGHEILGHTGQHYDYEMSGIFFDGLQIPKPNVNLGIGSGSPRRDAVHALDVRIFRQEVPSLQEGAQDLRYGLDHLVGNARFRPRRSEPPTRGEGSEA
jgi:hypothetical protein